MLRFRGFKSQYLQGGNNAQLFSGNKLENINEVYLKFEFPALWKFGPGREFTENPWQHIKLSHLSLQTRFFILRHLRKQQLYSESSRWNISSNIEDHLEILASWELFRQKWVLCNSAAKGFFWSHFHLIKTSTQLQIKKIIFLKFKMKKYSIRHQNHT